jgi:hypothetical protein
MDPDVLDARLDALRNEWEGVNADDGQRVRLQAQILEILFDQIPAERGAVLLSWPDASGDDPEDFYSSLYRRRSGRLTEGFELSGKALEFVYGKGRAHMSNTARPALLCAALTLPDGEIFGLIYLDTCEIGRFERHDLRVLKKITAVAEELIHDSLRIRFMEDINQIYGNVRNVEPWDPD